MTDWTQEDVQQNARRLQPAPRATPFVKSRLAELERRARSEPPGRLMREVASLAQFLGESTVTHDPQSESDPVQVNIVEFLRAEDALDAEAEHRRQMRIATSKE